MPSFHHVPRGGPYAALRISRQARASGAKRSVWVLFSAVLLAVAAPASAQTTTGRLMGNVVDDAGAPLPGVGVTIASPALIGGARTRLTDDSGEFGFLLLAPGDYTVTASLAAFITQERAGVKVPLGGAAAITITMSAGTFSGEIEVKDETPVVDPTQASTGQVFEHVYIQESAIGSANRDYLVVVNQAAGVASGGSWGNIPQPRVFGSTVGENAYFIDGVNATDPVMMIGTIDVNFDAIDEIQLLTGGFEAEHGFATGGIVNLLTRSGGNDFSGTLDLRYRDDSFQESGDHYDAGELSSKHEVFGATLGGPILRDRLWFFASYQWIDDEYTPIASLTTYDDEAPGYLAKVTWQAHPSWRGVGTYSKQLISTENLFPSRWVMPEAGLYAHGSYGVSSIQLSAVLSDSLLWETTAGRYEVDANVHPMSGDLQTIGHYNYDTGLYTENNGNQQYWAARRNELATNLTRFVDHLIGAHELKGGLEYADLKAPISNCSTGTPNGARCVPGGVGFFFNDVQYEGATLPWTMWEYTSAGQGVYTGAIWTAFFQDAWQPTRDFTLKVGLRYDSVHYDTTHGIEVADMDKWQPRLGVAWDLTGDASNVLRASWGRFLHPSTLSLPWDARADAEPYDLWYSCSGYLPFSLGIAVGSAGECAAAAGDLGWEYRNDNAGWDPYGWALAPTEHYGTNYDRGAPDIRATYADELILAFERQIADRSSIELSFVDKATHDVIEGTCSGNWPVPGASEACDYMVFGNIPGVRRDYRGLTVRLETRSLDWLNLLASYTWSKSEGSMEYSQTDWPDFDVYPWHFDNRYGFLSDHRTHRVKVNGFVTLSGDWSLAFDGSWSSAFTWTPYEDAGDNPEIPYDQHFLEPRGSRDANDVYQLDLRLEKGFAVGPARVALIGSAYNVFSSEQPTALCEHISGCGIQADGAPIAMANPIDWQTPRRYELGFRVEF